MINKKRMLYYTLTSIKITLVFIIVFCTITFGQSNKKRSVQTDSSKAINYSSPDSARPVLAGNLYKGIKAAPLLNNFHQRQNITKNSLETTDYRFTEEILNNASGIFVKKLGNTAAPTEVSLYGLNAVSTAFLNDGINFTNRLTNHSDLHLFQSESIDSVELIPLSRGFLLGNSNISAVNFISREPSTNKPYSRLKYYQAPAGEGLIDGIFNFTPLKKLNALIELTNQRADPYFINSQFSIWMGNIRLNYFLSPTATVRVNYKHVKSTVELNGGVDVKATGDKHPNFLLDDIIYDNVYASVRFPNRYLTSTNNFFSASLFSKFIGNSPTEFSVYYKEDLAEFRQNISGNVLENVLPVSHNNKAATLGGRIRQDYKTNFLLLSSVTSLERSRFNSQIFEKEITQTSFSSFASIDLKLANENIIPSGFIKYLNESNKSYLGYGADATFNFGNHFFIYAGISNFEKPISQIEKRFYLGNLPVETQEIKTAELKASINFDLVKISAAYFVVANNNNLLSVFLNQSDKLNDIAYYATANQITNQGITLQTHFALWKIYFNTTNNFYLSKDARIRSGLPQFSSNGGIYYIDTLFNQNLKLKAGFNYYSYGSRYEQKLDFEKGISSSYLYEPATGKYSLFNSLEYSPSFQIDFFLAGRIQDSAIIYFTWENLFNSKYFIVPYYPLNPRGLRFGVAWEFLD